jgi:hypothetical protein
MLLLLLLPTFKALAVVGDENTSAAAGATS